MRTNFPWFFFVVVSLISGAGHIPQAIVYCNDDHTVDIKIENVDDVNEWNASEWRLQNNPACDPTLDVDGEMVNYENLTLPDCSFTSTQYPDHIKYILKIIATKPNPGGTQQLRAYDHLYYVSCEYDNQNRSMASFVPIVNRNDNDTGMENEIATYFATFKSTTFTYEH